MRTASPPDSHEPRHPPWRTRNPCLPLPCRTITWFPGHMAKAMVALQRVIKHVDLVLEVRDARVRGAVA